MSDKFPSEKSPSLARLPGQIIDNAARERRRALETEEISTESVVRNIEIQSEKDFYVKNVERYALASYTIEIFWDYLKQKLEDDSAAFQEQLSRNAPKEAGISERFMTALNATLAVYRDRFIDEYQKRSNQDAPSKESLLVMRYLCSGDEEELSFPSMADLVTMVGRVAEVTPRVFERDLGRAPTAEEINSSLRHPSLKRLFVGMMTNSRLRLLPTSAYLENEAEADLNDYSRVFDPKFFGVVAHDGEAPYVRMYPKAVQWFRDTWEIAAEKLAAEGSAPARALTCPALYTGKFSEMHDWIVGEYGKFAHAEAATNKSEP
jgi:hypothetical protein